MKTTSKQKRTPDWSICIGDKNLSSWSLRGWLVLKQTDVPFQEIPFKVDTPTTRQKIIQHSPSGFVPMIKHGDFKVWDTLAISEYLAETFPQAKLWPTDVQARARARSVAAEMHAGFSALRQQLPMHCCDADPKKIERIDLLCQQDISRVVEIWEECRNNFGKSGDFLFGHFTIADAFYAPVVIRFKIYNVALSGVAKKYAETIWNFPALQEWIRGAKEELKQDHLPNVNSSSL